MPVHTGARGCQGGGRCWRTVARGDASGMRRASPIGPSECGWNTGARQHASSAGGLQLAHSRGPSRPHALSCPRHRGRVRLGGTCVRSGSGSDTRGGSCLWRMCAPQGAPCKRAGGRGEEGALGEHAAIAEERAVLCAVLPCCPDSLARHEHRGCGQTLGVPPHSTAQAAACRFVEESGAGGRWSRVRWSRERCGCRLRCSSVGNVRWWGVAMGSAPERGDGGEGAPSAR